MKRTIYPFGLAGLLLLAGCSGEPPPPVPTAQHAEEIVGGVTDTGTGSHPAVVYLTNGGGACTGSLIAPNLVLTARHCVAQNITQGIGCDIYGASSNGDHVGNNNSPSSLKIFTGVSPQFWGTPVAVGTQLFTAPGKNLCNNDIALIVLNKAITGVVPMRVRLDWGPVMGEKGTAVGYGITNQNSPGSSGTRRRRTNVPVLSVGQDWNELTGSNEFSTGQGVCSGDSGGPFVSPGGAVMGIASRVSNCNDPNASAKFVRLDSHKALILQAFAAAGASPQLETGSPPPTVPPKATGDGPCTTGAECTSFLCLKSAGYCTQFCSNTPCPTGTVCTDTTLNISGQSIKEKACTKLGGANACEQCRNTQCVNVMTSCYNNPACQTILSCVDACTDANCAQACVDATPAGFDDYDLVRYCACNTSCKDSCSHQCGTPGTGGAGGAAGGGAGGAGNTGNFGGFGAVGTGGAAAAAGAPPAQASSGSSGGCATAPGPVTSPWWLALSLLTLARRRRRG